MTAPDRAREIAERMVLSSQDALRGMCADYLGVAIHGLMDDGEPVVAVIELSSRAKPHVQAHVETVRAAIVAACHEYAAPIEEELLALRDPERTLYDVHRVHRLKDDLSRKTSQLEARDGDVRRIERERDKRAESKCAEMLGALVPALDEIARLTRELAEARAALLAVAAQVSRRDGLRVDTAPSTIDAIRAAEKEGT